jgi:RHS repeat-associated protein
LQPALLTDPNGNRSQAAFDGLGLVAGSAIMGKATESLGDSLSGFTADLLQEDIDQFFSDSKGSVAVALLGKATSRAVYDFGRYARLTSTPTPVFAATIARETHISDLPPGQNSKFQVSFSYSDGFGREIQRKIQAESNTPGWVASGWTIFSNKGKPVRQYEPFFDDTNDFRFGVTAGVSPILLYDPAGRAVVTVHPDHSWEKIVFDPWRQQSWDRNDTVLLTAPKTDADVGPYFARLPDADYLPTWYTQNAGGTSDQQDAAKKASLCAETPATAFLDTLGRTFLTIAYNRTQSSGGSPVEEHNRTLLDIDIEGNQRSVADALNRRVMTYDYDMLGNKIHQVSVDAGERWMLNDAPGKPLLAWDSLDHRIRHQYDALRRPTNSYVQAGANVEVLAERIVYGEGQANDQALNLRTRLYQQFDGAGLITNSRYDFKGNPVSSTRQLLQDYKGQVDWSQSPTLEAGSGFTTSMAYDALNRPVSLTTPDTSVIRPIYNERSLLSQVSADLRDGTKPFVNAITYNPKGQRLGIDYANGASTAYEYDANTFRLTHLATTRKTDNADLQDLRYSYDPVGNITRIGDAAQQTIYFNNQVVTASGDYTYDALYRLTAATGREHIGQVSQPQPEWDDSPRMNQPLPNDPVVMRNYSESYSYDAVGNILKMVHHATNGSWTRTYGYDEPLVPYASNRLTSTTVGTLTGTYQYNANGDMARMPHLPLMQWDFKDQLQATSKQLVDSGTPETTYYVYDASGQRVRKITEGSAAAGAVPVRTNERIYLGVFEIYRNYTSNGMLERQTLHIMDNKRRTAMVETKTIDQGKPVASPIPLRRHQFDNQLGSACLELDDKAAIISYEEYYPYGSTSYQAVNNAIQISAKRYRYTGKERDDESGLYYHAARYYSPWLARWTSSDPLGLIDGPNLYSYTRANPVKLTDPSGKAGQQKVNDVVPYNERLQNRSRIGENPQKDHIISQAKQRLINRNIDTSRQLTVVQETGRAKGNAPAKPHTVATFHDPQADVPEIRRLRALPAQDWKSFSDEIIEPSLQSRYRAGYDVNATNKALLDEVGSAFEVNQPNRSLSASAPPLKWERLPDAAIDKETRSIEAASEAAHGGGGAGGGGLAGRGGVLLAIWQYAPPWIKAELKNFLAGGLRIDLEARERAGLNMDPDDWAKLRKEQSERLYTQVARGLAYEKGISEHEARKLLGSSFALASNGPVLRADDGTGRPLWQLAESAALYNKGPWENFKQWLLSGL